MGSLPSPYKRSRRPAALDEDRLVLRYTRDEWSMAQCGRVFGVRTETVAAVLREHGVTLREQRRDLDEHAILRAYDRFGRVDAVAAMFGTYPGRVREILGRHGVPRHMPSKPPWLENGNVR